MNAIPISVLVIENHPMMREALCAAINEETDMKVGMQAANVTQALWMAMTIIPDIILLALDHPEHGDMDQLAVLRTFLPTTPILALVNDEAPGQEQAALDNGAQAALTKAAPRTELIHALRKLRAPRADNRQLFRKASPRE